MPIPRSVGSAFAKLPDIVSSTAHTLSTHAKDVDWRYALTLVPPRFRRTPILIGVVALGLAASWWVRRQETRMT